MHRHDHASEWVHGGADSLRIEGEVRPDVGEADRCTDVEDGVDRGDEREGGCDHLVSGPYAEHAQRGDERRRTAVDRHDMTAAGDVGERRLELLDNLALGEVAGAEDGEDERLSGLVEPDRRDRNHCSSHVQVPHHSRCGRSSARLVVVPHRQTQPKCPAGLPATSSCDATDLTTTAPAATIANSPTSTPQTIVALAPIDAPRRTKVVV